jgi:hypothetical protein
MKSHNGNFIVRRTFLVLAVCVALAADSVTVASAQSARPGQPAPMQPAPVPPPTRSVPPGSTVQPQFADGDAPAGPTLFYYFCQTLDPNKSCGGGTERRKEQVEIEKPVPALKPGESYKVGLIPRNGVFWSTQADKNHEVVELDEGNNSFSSGDLK